MISPPPRRLRALLGLSISALLAACGGGGGGDPVDGGNGPCCYDYSSFVVPPPLTGPDPLLPAQWHLENTGQMGGTPGEDLNVAGPSGAWALGTKGEGVRVAIVDDAVEVVHPDLAPNFQASQPASYYNYRFPGQLPLPYYFDEDHGTSVAGIAVARDGNEIFGAGVAPRASLGAYNALATSFNADIADALGRDRAVTGVYNNSWGSPDNGVLNAAESSFVTAIETGITSGRSGKGSIYVFPAGNGGCYLQNADGSCALSENSNFDGYVNKRGVIAVCSVGDNGRAPFYAEPGANILVCGRSGNNRIGITTLMPRGAERSNFNGSSASTPMVSGIVALILKERPDLTWRDVRLILAKSARQNDPADTGWTTNFGLHFNPKYGFGAADAAAAVALAKTWTSIDNGSPVMKSCTVNRPFVPARAIPDSAATPVTDGISIDAGHCGITRIEFVEVRFRATHGYAGDLRIELISPAGQVSLLANERVCNLDNDDVADSCGNYDDPGLPPDGWQFGSVRHLEEPAAGTWTLRVADAQAGDTGTWSSWGLTIWGR
ncbi:MAG: S8 family serine peptidase [Burkholderiaceae bacterium]|nr:S8 family serine peptidase [Burkholderiaceae bacterium]